MLQLQGATDPLLQEDGPQKVRKGLKETLETFPGRSVIAFTWPHRFPFKVKMTSSSKRSINPGLTDILI